MTDSKIAPIPPAAAAVPSGASISDRYQRLRAQIEHEDGLITQRLNWFLTSQSFLFTALAIVFTSNSSPNINPYVRATLMHGIPLIAISAGIMIWTAILAGLIVLRHLRRQFTPWQDLATAAGLPPLQGSCATRMLGALAPVVLPILFVVLWLIVAVQLRWN